MDFKKKFIEQNENVWSKTIRPSFISINGDDIKVSTNPYSMEKAEHGLVIFYYTYTVITQNDCCMVPLFFNSNGEIEDYIEIDGWKLYFSKPITALYRCDYCTCYMSKESLKLSITTYPWKLDDEFERIWHLFSVARSCQTQRELDFAYKIFESEGEILSLKEDNLKDKVKIDELNALLDTHNEFIEKIKKLINNVD